MTEKKQNQRQASAFHQAEGERHLFRPIGHIESALRERFDAPHQGVVVPPKPIALTAKLSLVPELSVQTLRDLEGFDRVWLVYVFHLNPSFAETVRPPRDKSIRRGVFSTRSPDRPNAIGLSCVKLLRIEGNTLHFDQSDLLHGTPVLDIKPYIPYADAFPDAKAGWVDTVNDEKPPVRGSKPPDLALERRLKIQEENRIAALQKTRGKISAWILETQNAEETSALLPLLLGVKTELADLEYLQRMEALLEPREKDLPKELKAILQSIRNLFRYKL